MPIDLQTDNWILFFHKGPARTWIARSTYGYDKWIPSELFLTHYFPDDPEESQLVNVASLILGHDGIWGDLLSVSPEGVARIGRILGLWRQVRDSMAAAPPVRVGAVGGSGEVHEKIDHTTGRGAIVLFSTATGRQRYVSEHPVVEPFWATPGTVVTLDAFGHAIVDVAFEKPGAAIVFFGAQERQLGRPPTAEIGLAGEPRRTIVRGTGPVRRNTMFGDSGIRTRTSVIFDRVSGYLRGVIGYQCRIPGVRRTWG